MNHEGRTIEAPHILAETVRVCCDTIVGVLETGHHPLLPPEVNLSMRDARARAACDIRKHWARSLICSARIPSKCSIGGRLDLCPSCDLASACRKRGHRRLP